MNLEDLIRELKKSPREDYIRIDKSPVTLSPYDVRSYRGYYEQLAITVSCGDAMCVGDFVALLEEKIGTTMHGYKGGEYEIGLRTKVWISNWGECSDSLVTGTRREGWGCTFITWVNENDDKENL